MPGEASDGKPHDRRRAGQTVSVSNAGTRPRHADPVCELDRLTEFW
jgi:hypothetical protein